MISLKALAQHYLASALTSFRRLTVTSTALVDKFSYCLLYIIPNKQVSIIYINNMYRYINQEEFVCFLFVYILSLIIQVLLRIVIIFNRLNVSKTKNVLTPILRLKPTCYHSYINNKFNSSIVQPSIFSSKGRLLTCDCLGRL